MCDGRRFGRPPDPYTPPEAPAGKVNLTDPDCRNVKTPRGYMQGLQRPSRRHGRQRNQEAGGAPVRARSLSHAACTREEKLRRAGDRQVAVLLPSGAMATIPQKELRNNVGEVLRRAETGERFTITVSGRPVAQLGPVRDRAWVDSATLSELWQSPPDWALAKDLERFGGSLRDPWAG